MNRSITTARDLHHSFTCWMDAPLDNHNLNRPESLQPHWELRACIDKLTSGATAPRAAEPMRATA